MKIFTLLVNDRHTDPEIHLFNDKDLALDKSREIATTLSWNSLYTEVDLDGYIFYAEYTTEGDYVRVEEKEVQEY